MVVCCIKNGILAFMELFLKLASCSSRWGGVGNVLGLGCGLWDAINAYVVILVLCSPFSSSCTLR